MDFEQLTKSFPWALYSKKLASKIESMRQSGLFTNEEAEARQVRLATGEEGTVLQGNAIRFYLLVDKDDGTILDARYQAYGQSALIGAAEALSALVIGKNYDQARRIHADLIDKEFRDKDAVPAFPQEAHPHINLVIDALDKACDSCTDLPLPDLYVAPPVPKDIGEVLEGGYPGWDELPLKKKLAVIEDVLDREIRPYIALDAGGVEVINLINNREVVITYSGSCTSCYSSVGTTLSYVQQMLRAKVHPEIVVTPNLDALQF